MKRAVFLCARSTALLPKDHKNPIRRFNEKMGTSCKGHHVLDPETCTMSCNAKVYAFTSSFDRIVIFSYQICYISSVFVFYASYLYFVWKIGSAYYWKIQRLTI